VQRHEFGVIEIVDAVVEVRVWSLRVGCLCRGVLVFTQRGIYTSHRLVQACQLSGSTYCLHLQDIFVFSGRWVPTFRKHILLPPSEYFYPHTSVHVVGIGQSSRNFAWAILLIVKDASKSYFCIEVGCSDGSIILKWIFERLDGGTLTGLIWLRIGTGGGLLWIRWWTFGFHKMRGISWVAYDITSFSGRTLLHGVSYCC
jgi:hypothetical protein